MRTICLLASSALWMSGAAAAAEPLTLEEVLDSVERHHPKLIEALQEPELADARLLGTQGEFDLKLKSKFDTEQFGYYRNRTFDLVTEQPLQTWGSTVYGGYKRGTGNYGPWRQDSLSLDRGEVRTGFNVPLFRDRSTDRRRTNLQLAELGIETADAAVDLAHLDLRQKGAKAYWDWVAAARNLGIARELLATAENRNQALIETIEAGQAAPIERVDNQRAILQRQSQVVDAERDFRQATLMLSLYYRDDAGAPREAPIERAPDFPEAAAPTDAQVADSVAEALGRRPELRALLLAGAGVAAETRLARNQLAPSVDVGAEFSVDGGAGSITKRGEELKARISFELPFQRRKAKGKLAEQAAKRTQVEQKLQFARESIAAEVRALAAALEAAERRLELARGELEVARTLEQAERDRFALGDSTIFMINLRELATADAALKAVKAAADFHKTAAEYRAATAAGL